MLGLTEALKIVHEAEFCHIVSITYDIRAWIKHIDNFQCRADTKVDNEYKSFAYSAKGWFSYDHQLSPTIATTESSHIGPTNLAIQMSVFCPNANDRRRSLNTFSARSRAILSDHNNYAS